MTTEDLYTHYLTEDLLDACGQAPRGAKVTFTPVIEDVTCRACRDKVRPALHARIEAHAERTDVVEKLTALLAAWEEGVASADGLARIREAGDVYVEALAEFIDSRAPVHGTHKSNYGVAGMGTGILPNAHRCADCTFTTASAERMDGHVHATGHRHESQS